MPDNADTLFKKISRIQFQTTRLANDVLAGAYRSAFKGRGMEFEEVREYQPGDEVRTIDWNVTARMQRPFVKSFREEREITMTLLVDISSSTRFGSGQQLKSELIAEIAALLAFSAIKNNDKVSLILFSDRVEKYFPPNKGTRHVLRVIRELLAYKPEGHGTDIAAALSFLGKIQQHSSICFLISDFICPDYSHEAAIIAKRHDLVAISIEDAAEKQFPSMNLVSFVDLESGRQQLVDTNSTTIHQVQIKNSETRIGSQKKLMHRLGADFLHIQSDKPYLPQLRKFFLIRQKRQQ